MAKMKAPEGGAIVNGTYFTGGKFLPRILKRIKAVRKNAKPVQLARLDNEDLVSLIHAAHHEQFDPPLLDWLEENDHPLLPFFKRHRKFAERLDGRTVSERGVTVSPPGYGSAPGVTVPHVALNTPAGTIYAAIGRVRFKQGNQWRETPGAAVAVKKHEGPTLRFAAPMTPEELEKLHALHSKEPLPKEAYTFGIPLGVRARFPGLRPVAKKWTPEQLAREPDAPHVSYARILPDGGESFSMPTLKHDDLVSLEEHHKIPEKKRLTKSANYKYDPETGHIQNAKVEHLHSLLDAVAASPETSLPKGLRGEKLFTHLLTHAVKDAKTYLPLIQGEWYTGSVQQMDSTLHDILSREKPFHPDSKKYDEHPLWGKAGDQTPALKLFKTVIGFTSNNQDPASNLVSALRILKTGVDKDPLRPFEGMDEYNNAPMHDFLAQLAKKHNATNIHYVGLTPEEHTAWHQKFGADLLKASRSSAPVSVVEGLKDISGRIVGRRNLEGKDLDTAGNPLPKGKYERVLFPALTPDGHLRPKGWSNRAKTNAEHIRLLNHVIRETGGYEQAARWLEGRHPKQEVNRMRGSKVKTGELENPELGVPGAFIFGEKQGPFMANISGNPEHVTQDVWWTRSINRWLGKLTKNASAPNTSQKQFYARVAREAAKELGTTPANLQAILWYAEQHMHRLFGTKSESLDFADAAKRARAVYGFPPASE